MILEPVSLLDCFIFLVFLAPQLMLNVGFFPTLFCGLQALPFLVVKLPLSFIYENLLLSKKSRSPFTLQATWFEDLIIRCVRYAFARIPARIGRVFFSKPVALPFLGFRMLRHGYLRSPIHWHEIKKDDFEGLWIIADGTKVPDIVIYYAHGGGFSMGSSYFYLEFLLAYLSLLKSTTKFNNPAILALEYTLVPDASYPVQLHQAIAGYKHLLSITHDSAKIVVSGDSAGATIILSLLLHIGKHSEAKTERASKLVLKETSSLDVPGMAVLISPWATLISTKDQNTSSDYLDITNLEKYAHQYCGNKISTNDPLISPGKCKDASWWKDASPSKGFFISYGAEEVFAPEIKDLIMILKESGVRIESQKAEGGIHAWPVASLFLSSTREKRLRGLQAIVQQISERVGPDVFTKN